MASRHVCSNPECGSKRFVTSSHVVEDWLVDEFGNYIEVISTNETDHGPDDDNCWTCAECGAEAVVATNAA